MVFPQDSRSEHIRGVVSFRLFARKFNFQNYLKGYATELRLSNGFDFSSYRSNLILYLFEIQIEFRLISETPHAIRNGWIRGRENRSHVLQTSVKQFSL
jgi:hypothetical protein